MKNMQYVPIQEKPCPLPVDNSLLTIVLALLAMSCEQARRELQNSTAQQKSLPVIAF